MREQGVARAVLAAWPAVDAVFDAVERGGNPFTGAVDVDELVDVAMLIGGPGVGR